MDQKTTGPGRHILFLEGLSCTSCAQKIEAQTNAITGVLTSEINFAAQRLTLTVSDKKALPDIVRQASSIINAIEPDMTVSSGEKPAADNDETRKMRVRQIAFVAGVGFFVAGLLANSSKTAALALFLISYVLIGGAVVFRALQNILKGDFFDENFLMSVATIGAFAIGQYPEGVAVMLFYQVGEAFEHLAVSRSRRSIAALMDIRPDTANLKIDGTLRRVAPEDVAVGDLIVVKPGEKIPLDGRVVEGRSALDTSALTGEALFRDVEPGSAVLSGSVNQNGLLTIAVTKVFGDSTVSKILDLVQNAGSKKAPTETFITKFARFYTPFVVFSALALAIIPPLIIPGAVFHDWLSRALVFLVVSCPCALVISIPLSYFGGIGGASRNGILIKGGNYLEALNTIDTVVFDKTGTLTKGVFDVTETTCANGWSEAALLDFAVHAESFSNHPIAVSLQKAFRQPVRPERVGAHEELPGLGVRVMVDGKEVLAGNGRLMASAGIEWQVSTLPGSIVYVAIDGVFAGSIVIADTLKPDSRQTIEDLKALGVRKTVMLTGDVKTSGEAIAASISLDAVVTDLLPAQKVAQLEVLQQEKQKSKTLVFVGDGVNDAPVLARADVGVSMGALGSDAAIEAADIVLMTDEPSKLVSAIRIARRTRAIVWQNIIFALSVKAVILLLGALGLATMWEAVFGDVGVALLAILNAMRAMRLER
ncbi:heavy metal translocating P-type ATPase [Oscillospiraceae bacterium WX1]